MRIGCCGSMIFPHPPHCDPVGAVILEDAARLGFDYIELSLAGIAALPEEAFAALTQRLDASGLRCEACNNFFPPRVRLTGPDARLAAALDYARPAMDRASRLGAEIIVFGSSGAKNVPPGFDMSAAWTQIVDLLRHIGAMAAERGITIAIEPLNRQESNIINLAAEGLALVAAVNHPHVQLLIDYYHLRMEQESSDIVVRAGAAMRHLHVARIEGRTFPTQPDDALRQFFRCVRQTGYHGRCSIEAYTDDFRRDAPAALKMVRSAAETP